MVQTLNTKQTKKASGSRSSRIPPDWQQDWERADRHLRSIFPCGGPSSSLSTLSALVTRATRSLFPSGPRIA